MHTMQTNLLKKNCIASVTMKTFRERFIKIAAQVRELKTKITLEAPCNMSGSSLA